MHWLTSLTKAILHGISVNICKDLQHQLLGGRSGIWDLGSQIWDLGLICCEYSISNASPLFGCKLQIVFCHFVLHKLHHHAELAITASDNIWEEQSIIDSNKLDKSFFDFNPRILKISEIVEEDVLLRSSRSAFHLQSLQLNTCTKKHEDKYL